MKYVIVGGIAGGPSFATRLRRLDEDAEIIILERHSAISVASCALPYYLSGVVPDRETLIERTPEILKEKNNIDVRLFNNVTNIDPDKRQLTVHDTLNNETYTESYDELLLATGASPTLPPVKNLAEADNAFVLRTIDNADAIKAFIDDNHPKHVAILGGGAIGIELAESFDTLGLAVTIIERSSTIASPYDAEIAEIVTKELHKHNIEILTGHSVASLDNDKHELLLDDGTRLAADMIFIGTGVRPNTELAAKAKIALTDAGHIVVNSRFQTNQPHIYAIGDAIETINYITGLPTPSVLSSPANRQGHLLADIMKNAPFEYQGIIGAGVSKFFDLTVSYTGYTEAMLQANGITDYKKVFITPYDHAYFYPGPSRVSFKLLFDAEGKILGAQAVGETGVDKRISQISAAIRGHLNVYDLPDVEVPYSPPYSSTRDVINIAGYVAINQLTRQVATIKAGDIAANTLNTAYFLDIRESDRPEAGSIPATANIPLSQLRERIAEIPKDKPVYVTYRAGIGPYNASTILKGQGYDVTLIEE
ncbi:MAG: FAD-dependent oxidoreductase [Lactobacillus sp.]|jgi:NADPH-dependent 2,4-dienoyl-CoA reductase/sulfur reductase-like enzyme/rhodanese-related sulfurtransferase|nr:FAD-dependent oxidoreductase [Lactobacillus sp.]